MSNAQWPEFRPFQPITFRCSNESSKLQNIKVNQEGNTMRLNLLPIIAALALGGCAISKDMYLPDGSKGYNISCDGSANSISTCYQKAGDICGAKGYVLLNREGEAVPFGYSSGSASANTVSAQGSYVSQAGMFVNRSIFVKCKD